MKHFSGGLVRRNAAAFSLGARKNRSTAASSVLLPLIPAPCFSVLFILCDDRRSVSLVFYTSAFVKHRVQHQASEKVAEAGQKKRLRIDYEGEGKTQQRCLSPVSMV